MRKQSKLILINGFAGVGKTTIAKHYIQEHPLSLSIEGDELIWMVGQWITYEKEAREYVFALIKSMTTTHLTNDRTVVLPYFLTNANHAEEIENIAKKQNVYFFEILLSVDKEDAMRRLLARGNWGGEAGLTPITEEDLPIINEKYDVMMEEAAKRPNTVRIPAFKDDITRIYESFLDAIGESTT